MRGRAAAVYRSTKRRPGSWPAAERRATRRRNEGIPTSGGSRNDHQEGTNSADSTRKRREAQATGERGGQRNQVRAENGRGRLQLAWDGWPVQTPPQQKIVRTTDLEPAAESRRRRAGWNRLKSTRRNRDSPTPYARRRREKRA